MKLQVKINCPEGISVECKNGVLVLTKGDKSIHRAYPRSRLTATVAGNVIEFSVDHAKFRPLIGTFAAHVRNMITGLTEPFVYELKVCSTHFPMSAKIDNGKLLIGNFLGSKDPRKVKLIAGVDVNVKGEIITVKSHDIELAGRVASQIENSTRLCNKDRRVFQDGVYITKKPNKEL